MDYAIEIRGLNKHYPGFDLEDVDISVPSGCIMGFVGANGAGKTTTIKSLLGLIRPDKGTIKIFGKDYASEGKAIREDVGVVFDESCFPDGLNAGEISRFMGRIYTRWDAELFQAYMKKFAIPVDKKVKEFSRGMKMKLSIAAALAHHPKLLVLDEATSGLDPLVRDEILDLFLDFIQDEEHTVFISSHITSDLEKVADYITFINNGRIILSGEKDLMMEEYGVAHCDDRQLTRIPKEYVVGMRRNKFGVDVLIRSKEKFAQRFPEIFMDAASIEEILLFEARGEKI